MSKKSRTENWQLFLDDYIIARSTGLSRVVHHPRAMGVVIPADKPWETFGVSPTCIHRREDGTFIAYYISMWWDCDAAIQFSTEGMKRDRAHHTLHGVCYATSLDGIHWEKPNLGLSESPAGIDWDKNAPFPSPQGATMNNNLGLPFLVLANLGAYGNVSDPDKRYVIQMIHSSDEDTDFGAPLKAKRRYFAREIPDFLHDPAWREKLIDSGSELDPRRHNLHFWDDIHEEWVSMEQGVIGHWLPSREIARFASKDLVGWTSDSVLYPDCADPHLPQYYDEPMDMTPFCAEGIVFGLLSWFHGDRTHPEGGPVLEPSPEHPNRWPWARKGTNEMRITVSRDGGKTWDRSVSREAWIPHGTEEDSYDRVVLSGSPPIRVGDEDWFYMRVVDSDHLIIRNNPAQHPYNSDRIGRHQVALYVQKHNRYVSLQAGNRREVLITKPMEVSGDSLQLNVDAARGIVRVGIGLAEPVMTFNGTTPSMAPHLLAPTKPNYSDHLPHADFTDNLLPGFSFDDCEPITINSIEHTVKFKSASFIAIKGKRVRLLFEMQNANVYGFRFSGSSGSQGIDKV